jgi:hypothetical protein
MRPERHPARVVHHTFAPSAPSPGHKTEELTPALSPVLAMIANLSEEIRALDENIEEMAQERYPETALLSQVPGVGTLTATVYVLTVEDPERFPKSRAVGSYLGLRPRQSQEDQPPEANDDCANGLGQNGDRHRPSQDRLGDGSVVTRSDPNVHWTREGVPQRVRMEA